MKQQTNTIRNRRNLLSLTIITLFFGWKIDACHCDAAAVQAKPDVQVNLPAVLRNKQVWASEAKSNPDFLFETTVDAFIAKNTELKAKEIQYGIELKAKKMELKAKEREIDLIDSSLTSKIELRDVQLSSLQNRLKQAQVDFLKATKSLSVRGVLERCEVTMSTNPVSAVNPRYSVWMGILQNYPDLFNNIQKYERTLSRKAASNTIVGIFSHASVDIHNYMLDKIALGKRTYSSAELACLKGILDYFPVPYTEDEEPTIGPMSNLQG